MATVLVTGADGFVARVLTGQLRAKGHRVLATARVRRGGEEIAVGDVGDYGQWKTLLDNVEVVIHLAARAHVITETSPDPMAEFRRVNVDATLRLAHAAAEVGVRRFIFLSSIGVNGTFTTHRPFSELDQPNPTEPYSISKWEAEQGLVAIGARTNLKITRVRPPLVLGPGVKGNLRRLLKLLDSGVPLPLGSVHNTRSFIALEDLCELLVLCVTHERATSELFLAADDENLSTPDLLRRMAAGLGKRVRLIALPLPMLNIAARLVGADAELQRMTSSLIVNARHAQEVLAWRPRAGIRQGIEAMTRAYLTGEQR